MRWILATFLFAVSTCVHAECYQLPFTGRWFVAQGGDTPNVNHHMSVRQQWYALDFAKVGGTDERALARSNGSSLEDFYGWEQLVLSPVEGVIETVVDRFPDNRSAPRTRATRPAITWSSKQRIAATFSSRI